MYYHIPFIYSLSHVILGYISFYCYYIGFIFIIYQIYQYYANIRIFFLFDIKILQGNSMSHTIRKLLGGVLGVVIATITYYRFY
jgi:hypothetical protein